MREAKTRGVRVLILSFFLIDEASNLKYGNMNLGEIIKTAARSMEPSQAAVLFPVYYPSPFLH